MGADKWSPAHGVMQAKHRHTSGGTSAVSSFLAASLVSSKNLATGSTMLPNDSRASLDSGCDRPGSGHSSHTVGW